MRFDDVVVTSADPSAWQQLPTPGVVVWLHRYLPLNPERWAALCAMCVMLVFTRKRTDRLAVLMSVIPFCLQVFPRTVVEPVMSVVAGQKHGALWLGTMLPFVDLIWMYALALALSIGLYVWTRNPIFWGQGPGGWQDTFSAIAIQLLAMVVASASCRWISSILAHRTHRTA